jgi:NAD(P)-dependent dehydrogenase (short-subunit alcohol dehydrogenase family)
MHSQVSLQESLLDSLAAKTVVITGGAAGIGAATSKLMASKGANVVIADLKSTKAAAEALISDFPDPSKAIFRPADILDWHQMNDWFKDAVSAFGSIDVVVANAGIMESRTVLDIDDVQDDGEPKAPTEAFNVIDINLKGTLNSESCLGATHTT